MVTDDVNTCIGALQSDRASGHGVLVSIESTMWKL